MAATIAVTVVGAVVGAVTKNVAAQAFKLVQKKCELWKNFSNDINFIRRELLMISGAEEDNLSEKGNPRVVRIISMEELRDLAQDIEDCLDRILRYTEASPGRRLIAVARDAGSPPTAAEVKLLKKRLKDAHQRKIDYDVNGNQPAAGAAPGIYSKSIPANTDASHATKIQLIGIDEPMWELLELLDVDDIEGQPEQLSVVSIVGFSGSGKSTLAKAVYDYPGIVRRFGCRAWVQASEHRGCSKGFLTALLEKLCPGVQANGDAQQLEAKISDYLNDKRYLIVLDDIEEHQWDSIKSSFPTKTRSRVIITTTIRPLAELCRNHVDNGYIYDMRTLDDKHSKELLEAVLKRHLPGLEQSSTLIVNKCDGHPLALVSVANYLLRKREFTEKDCKFFWRDLGSHMEKEFAFRKLKQILMSNYLTLPGCPDNLRTCLLYMSVFPNGHPIRKNSLVRRWFAEGYVQCVDPCTDMLVADKNIEALIDRNIILPIDSRRNVKVKTCRAHGIMHEFLRQMSIPANFITSHFHPKRSNYRHLYVEGRPTTSNADEKNLRAHSLTIFGSAGEAVGFLRKCELLRVLDMEECVGLNDEDIDDIQYLWHLKYLSLGASISRLPKEIGKLNCLQTLDAKKTKKEITLPLVVFELPYLAHLLGKFKLEKNWEKSDQLKKCVSRKSNLQTLAGFVADNDPGFPKLMVHMKKLQKVKVWCSNCTSSCGELSNAIKNFLQLGMDTGVDDRSLSLDLGNSNENILSSLENSLNNEYCYLTSLKIHGDLRIIPTQILTLLAGLRELCLSSTTDLAIDDTELSFLSNLEALEYLKLYNIKLGGLVVKNGSFKKLLHLCLVQCPNLPKVEEGAMPNLVSLWLLNENLSDPTGINIKWHGFLQEVALDSKVNEDTKTVLEAAAKKHPKKPRVLYFNKVDLNETGSMVEYVAAKRAGAETGSLVVQEEQQIPAGAQSSSTTEFSSALEQATFSEPTEQFIPMEIDTQSSSRVVS